MVKRVSSTEYDQLLAKIPHYRKHGLMRPYVGANYKRKKILLIGESFYLPNECQLNKVAGDWYSSNQKMIPADAKPWIDCRGLIECDWKPAGHFIYREVDRVLTEVIGEGFSAVAFMNAFQRPACKEGRSFRHDCESLDVAHAVDTRRVRRDLGTVHDPPAHGFQPGEGGLLHDGFGEGGHLGSVAPLCRHPRN